MKIKGTVSKKIVDIYHGNGNVDFAALKSQGYDGVIIKLTEGEGWDDPAADGYFHAAKEAGLEVGFYHYFSVTADLGYAQRQAAHYLTKLAPYQMDYKPAIDVEQRPGEAVPEVNAFSAAVKLMLDAVNSKYNAVMIYANPDMISNHFNTSLGDYDLWIANYNVTAPKDVPFFTKWTGWQYTDKEGLDKNFFADGIYLKHPDATPVPPQWTNDVHPVNSLPCQWNATAQQKIVTKNADGSVVANHQIDQGDQIIVLNINYDTQLIEVLYPAPSLDMWVHAFIDNVVLTYRFADKWKNGTTNEKIMSATGTETGTIFPHELATPLYKAVSGRFFVIFNTSKGARTKSGEVVYNGGFIF
jgi:hypothetical protein